MIDTKVVINKCFGGFQIRRDVADEIGWESVYGDGPREKDRTDPKLISVLERMLANGEDINPDDPGTELKIVEVPDDADWYITDYDGRELIEEAHRIWN